ncbi:MAG: hypothetical protein QM626_01300 [Microbacterium sp.]|uniref:hypothetical protein n=1 Tax=Microbacterium sp. TaxID=51671 RepID=UPI0039E51A94
MSEPAENPAPESEPVPDTRRLPTGTDTAEPTVPAEPPMLKAAAQDPPEARLTPPRTRWAAIVWGLFFTGVSAIMLWILTGADRREAVTAWARATDAPTAVAIGLLAVGVLLLVAGVAALLRRMQRRGTR